MRMFPIAEGVSRNELVFEVAEPGGIVVNFLVKVPGATTELAPAQFTFDYADSFCVRNQLEAYERLIHDAMIGDKTLFTRAGGIERLWEIATPLLDSPPPVQPYAKGSWGATGSGRADRSAALAPPGCLRRGDHFTSSLEVSQIVAIMPPSTR